MFIVVSKWSVKPGQWPEFESRAKQVRRAILANDGVSFVHGFKSEQGDAVAVVGYRDQAAYSAVVNDPSGPFAKALAEHGLEDMSEWVWSERGEVLPD